MKRALLIATGTVGGLGGVLSITPPAFLSSESAAPLAASAASLTTTTTSQTATADATPTASAKATPAAKKAQSTTSKSTTTKSVTTTTKKSPAASATKSSSTTSTTTNTPTTSTDSSVSGKFTGDMSSVGPYGGVVVQITVSNGKITDAQAIQAPGGRDQRYTDMSVPVLRQRVIAAQGANISGVSGASFTSYNFWMSLKSALSKAGI